MWCVCLQVKGQHRWGVVTLQGHVTVTTDFVSTECPRIIQLALCKTSTCHRCLSNQVSTCQVDCDFLEPKYVSVKISQSDFKRCPLVAGYLSCHLCLIKPCAPPLCVKEKRCQVNAHRGHDIVLRFLINLRQTWDPPTESLGYGGSHGSSSAPMHPDAHRHTRGGRYF